jgi:hypothetical protein
LAAISWLSIVGLGYFLDMLLFLNVTYILIGGIDKSPFKTASFVGRYIIFSPLDWFGFWICCSPKCCINSERLRSETNTPTRNCTSRTVGLQFSGQFGIVLIQEDLTVGCMLILDMLF